MSDFEEAYRRFAEPRAVDESRDPKDKARALWNSGWERGSDEVITFISCKLTDYEMERQRYREEGDMESQNEISLRISTLVSLLDELEEA